MNTTVYFIRHSEPIGKDFVENIENNNSLQIWNEKMPLSIDGEAKAKALSELSELQILIKSFQVTMYEQFLQPNILPIKII